MSAGYTFVSEIVGHHKAPLINAALVAAAVGTVGLIGRASISKSSNPLVPDDKLSPRTIFELLTDFFISLGDSTMGKENRRYLPFIAVLFTYIFFMNIFGLIPGFVLSTEQFTINFGVAMVVFVLYNIWGIRAQGLVNYVKHFWGPGLLIGGGIFVIELVSHSIRPLTLGLRLFGNMTGDHILLSVFNQLLPYPVASFVAVPFYMLGTLVSFIQAFVFTLLTLVYIRMALEHGH